MFFLSSKYLLKNTVIVHVIFVFLHPCTSGATTSHKIPPPRKCTFDGYFHDALAKTVQPCPGFLPCPKGFYCKDGNKIPCPAGTFGREEKNSNKACSGICPGGFYCPQGTIDPIECGGTELYCPLGSIAPLKVPPGFLSIGTAARKRDRAVPCPKGHYCIEGSKFPCPAGTYGENSALSTSTCSGLCPAGHFCPEASIEPTICPEGYYGASSGLKDPLCSGKCQAGFKCPPGSIAANGIKCGEGKYCPEGTGTVSYTPEPGYYVINGDSKQAAKTLPCPIGSYCTEGFAILCPGGTYGEVEGLSTSKCSGLCEPGYYCPLGSTSPIAFKCGGSNMFCPKGSARPIPVGEGYYTLGRISIIGIMQSSEDENIRSAQTKCDPGHYCIDGVKYQCPGGTYGNVFGLFKPECSGKCHPGHYCPPASILPTQRRCGKSDVYCPEGSAAPIRAKQGYCTKGLVAIDAQKDSSSTRAVEYIAPRGFYEYSGACIECPPGHYGDQEGETNSLCQGKCLAGYYCPRGSSSATQFECGSSDFYCPEGSSLPYPVDLGFYTTTIGLKQLEATCPPGEYRDLTTTSSSYYDLITGKSPLTTNYGDTKYPFARCVQCPLGTFKTQSGDDFTLCKPCPLYVSTSSADRRTCECFRLPGGFNTTYAMEVSGLNTKQIPIFPAPFTLNNTAFLFFNGLTCELVKNMTLKPIPVFSLIDAKKSKFTAEHQYRCESGFFCIKGIRYPCPAGYYGDKEGETDPLCAGKCSRGFYCPLASTNSTARPCLSAVAGSNGRDVYCPEGSPVPVPVEDGYYTVISDLNPSIYPDAQVQCEEGYFCIAGIKHPCPGGRYGDEKGETSPLCKAKCSKGFYCPEGSVSPTQIACGNSSQICRTGSTLPSIVPPGYYSLGGGINANSTRFHQRPCEPGYFCINGIKYQCPEGYYGATFGLSTSICSGICQPGYYCPSYPNAPSIKATQNECGLVSLYCPQGTGNKPFRVKVGFYTTNEEQVIGRSSSNTTQSGQRPCEKGFFCRNGIKAECPEGTFGNATELSATQCNGWCPAGYYCPLGSIEPLPCSMGTYSTKGASFCSKCPTQAQLTVDEQTIIQQFYLQNVAPCTNARECCSLSY